MRPPVHLTEQTRRTFLRRLAVVSAASLTGCTTSKNSAVPPDETSATTSRSTTPLLDRPPDRVLVIVNLDGGNDGLSTVVPAGSASYYDGRPNLAIDDSNVLEINDRVGLNPNLGRLHQRGLTIVEGVGSSDGDLSHFEMSDRWNQGDLTGRAGYQSGFGGRVGEALGADSPTTAISLAGSAPFLHTSSGPGLALFGGSDLWFLKPTEWEDVQAFQDSLLQFEPGLISQSYTELIEVGRSLDSVDDEFDPDDPMINEGGSLGEQLWLASDIISAGAGTQLIFAKHGSYDTHDNHTKRHDDLMRELDAAVDGFLDRAEKLGFADRVVVATTSEFGRRVKENADGLDHGSASSMLVAGAIEPKVLGEPPDLDNLDQHGNLEPTVGFDRYLASLAEEWLGVPTSRVLPGNPEILGLF